MKTLILIRHGKSDWATGLSDIDRPLNNRGLRDAPRMAEILKSNGIIPNTMFVSSAKRTTQTAQMLNDTFGLTPEEIISCPELYLCRTETALETIACAPNDIEKLAIVAHNPTLSYLCSLFSQKDYFDVPTLGIFIGVFDVDSWLDVKPETMTDFTFLYPKM
jgi:phosphohistidine phosphatase